MVLWYGAVAVQWLQNHKAPKEPESVRTVVFVRAMGVAVDGAGLAVCGPAGVSQAEVCVELLFQVQWIFLCVSIHGREAVSWIQSAVNEARFSENLYDSFLGLKPLHPALLPLVDWKWRKMQHEQNSDLDGTTAK